MNSTQIIPHVDSQLSPSREDTDLITDLVSINTGILVMCVILVTISISFFAYKCFEKSKRCKDLVHAAQSTSSSELKHPVHSSVILDDAFSFDPNYATIDKTGSVMGFGRVHHDNDKVQMRTKDRVGIMDGRPSRDPANKMPKSVSHVFTEKEVDIQDIVSKMASLPECVNSDYVEMKMVT